MRDYRQDKLTINSKTRKKIAVEQIHAESTTATWTLSFEVPYSVIVTHKMKPIIGLDTPVAKVIWCHFPPRVQRKVEKHIETVIPSQ